MDVVMTLIVFFTAILSTNVVLYCLKNFTELAINQELTCLCLSTTIIVAIITITLIVVTHALTINLNIYYL